VEDIPTSLLGEIVEKVAKACSTTPTKRKPVITAICCNHYQQFVDDRKSTFCDKTFNFFKIQDMFRNAVENQKLKMNFQLKTLQAKVAFTMLQRKDLCDLLPTSFGITLALVSGCVIFSNLIQFLKLILFKLVILITKLVLGQVLLPCNQPP